MLADLKVIFSKNSFHARIVLIIIYFEKRFFFKVPFKLLRKLINQAIYHCEIHPDSFSTIKAVSTIRLPHPFLIIIHRSCVLGENITIYHGVTIGVNELKNLQAAYIGDNVYIGCNSSILGDLQIVDNVKIGAHSLIIKSITKSGTITGLYK